MPAAAPAAVPPDPAPADRASADPAPTDLAAALRRAVAVAARGGAPEDALETAIQTLCELTGWPVGHAVLPDAVELAGGAALGDVPVRDSNVWIAGPAASPGVRAALQTAAAGPLPGGTGPDAPTAAGRAFAARAVARASLEEATDGDATDGDAAGGDGGHAGPVRAALAAAGLRSAVAVPVLAPDALDGPGGDALDGPRRPVAAALEFFTAEPFAESGGADGPDGTDELAGPVGEAAGAFAEALAAVLARARAAAALAARGRELDDLFQSAAAGLVLLDPAGTVLRANRAFAASLGASAASLAGAPVDSLLAPGGRGGGPLRAAARDGRPLLGHEADFRAAGGAVRTLLIDADGHRPPAPGPAELPAGGPAGPAGVIAGGRYLRCFTRDVTDRLRREQERNRLAAVVRGTPDAIVSRDLAGVVTTWNAGAERIYGLPAAAAVGRTAVDLGVVPRERAEEDRRLLALAAAGRRVDAFGTKRVAAGGRRLDVNLTVGPVRDGAGRIVGAAFVERDVTQQRRDAERLEQAVSRAEQASRAKTEFLANVSHELRTPMNAIIGLTELALDEPLPDHVADWLGTVRESADHLLALLNEILDFSRIESRRFELEPAPFDLREVVEETVKALARKADEKGLDLTGSVAAGLPDRLTGDAVRLRQVLTNLAGNAVKFTAAGSVAVRVEPADPVDGGAGPAVSGPPPEGTPVRLHISVRDTGPGIAAGDRERIFQPFAQADNTITRKYGGTGLGLSIARKLVGLMGGTLWLESTTAAELAGGRGVFAGEGDEDSAGQSGGPGTTFHVALTLPAAAPAPAADGLPAPSLRGLPVLVVDASPENRRLMREALESWNMEPVVAATADEAAGLLADAAGRGRAFPLVLADAALADLPGDRGAGGGEKRGGGPALFERAADAGATGVVLVTAGDRRRRRAGLDAPGVAGAVEKPVTRSELLDTIVAALGAAPVDGGDRGGRPRSVTPAERAARLNVLLVEDTAANRKVITAILERRGHAVAVARDGRAGVEAFMSSLGRKASPDGSVGALAGDPPGEPAGGRSRFDAVLMDVQMPVMDGLQATGSIRQIETARGLPPTPILALTAHALRGDRDRCLAAGMDGYLSKPIDVHELIGQLEAHARRGRRARRHADRVADRHADDGPVRRELASVHTEPPPRPRPEDDEPDGEGRDRGAADRLTPGRVRRPHAVGGPDLGPEVAAPPADDPSPGPEDPHTHDAAAVGGDPPARRGADPRAHDPADPRTAPAPPRPAPVPAEPAGIAAREDEKSAGDDPAEPPFDRAAALDRLAGAEDILAEIAGMYAVDAPQMCDAFDAAVARGDAEEARRSAHSLKGVSATVEGLPAKRAAHAAEVAAAAFLEDALVTGADPSKLPPADLAPLAAPGAAMRAAAENLAAALNAAFGGG